MKTRALLFPLLCLAFQRAGERPDPRYFHYQRPLVVPGAETRGQTCVSVDTNVFMHASRDLSDVRIYSGVREVPYVIQSGVNDSASPEQVSILNLGVRENRVVFDAHVTRSSYSSILLDVDKQDFVASVEVTGSQSVDGANSTRIGTFTIFDLTNQQLPRSTVLHLPLSTFPYLHFAVTGVLTAGDVKGITILNAPLRPLVYRMLAEGRRLTQQGRQSVIVFNLSGRVPVDRVEFVPASMSGNFRRDVSVETSPKNRNGAGPRSGTIYRIHTTQGGRRIDQEQYAIDVSNDVGVGDTSRVVWTVKIDNGDDAPLALQAVRLQTQERQLCFDATAGVDYTLYYGDTTLASPRYDYASLFQPQDHPNEATLAPEQRNPRFQPRADTRPLTDRYPALLWIVLVLVVILLGAVAVRTASRIQLPKDEGGPPDAGAP